MTKRIHIHLSRSRDAIDVEKFKAHIKQLEAKAFKRRRYAAAENYRRALQQLDEGSISGAEYYVKEAARYENDE